MKVGVETSSLNKKTTGTSRYLNCLINTLTELDVEVKQFSTNNSGDKKTLLNKIHRNWYQLYSIKNDIENYNPDYMLFPNYFMPLNYNGKAAIVIHDLSFISHPHFYSKSFVNYYKFRLKNTLKNKPLIITVSEFSRNEINKHLDIPLDQIFLLQGYYDLIDKIGTDNYPNLIARQEGQNEPYFLYVGHMEPRKNIPFLVENFIAWKNENYLDIKLKLVGEFWIKTKELKILLNKYLNHPDVEFVGYVSKSKLSELYQNASGFIHASFIEGFGFPVLEAMHNKLPILCTKNSATEEISKPYSITFDLTSVNSFNNGLSNLYNKYLVYHKMNYKIKYSKSLMKEQLVNILENLELTNNKKFFIQSPQAHTAKQAIKKTLLYSALFNSGIKSKFLKRQIVDLKLSDDKLSKTLFELIEEDKIDFKNGYFFLKNVLLNYYDRNPKQLNIKKAKRILKILKAIPFISSIAFSGGTANYGLSNHDDIDLFIITKPNSVFIAYFLIHLISKIFNARKIICANYLIDEANLTINNFEDLYTANQIISLIPFKNKNLLNEFFAANNWIQKFYPNFELPAINKAKTGVKIYSYFKPLNEMLMIFYKYLYKNKLKSNPESLSLNNHCIKLHTNDHRIKTLNAFNEAWENYCAHEEEIELTNVLRKIFNKKVTLKQNKI